MSARVAVTTSAVVDAETFDAIRPGDRVAIVTPQGQKRSGRCVMKFDTHAVLNAGGAPGTPVIATRTNTVGVKRSARDQRSALRPWLAVRG